MKILVCISCVPDTTSKINFKNNDTEFDTSQIQYIINPNDEFGLTRAIWFKENDGAEIDVISVGLDNNDQILRKALAIGADSAFSCLLYTSPSPRDREKSRMPSSA